VPKKDIRLEYSGFLIFAAKMISVATGLLFQLMVARATSKPEYDVWFNINDLLVYFTLMASILPFWTMRFVAREKEEALKTGILSNLTLSIVAALIYLPFVPLITSSLGISGNFIFLYFLIAAQVIELHSASVLEAYFQARIPHIIGYGLLIQQFCRVILGYVLIVILQQPLLGAVLATMVGFLVQIGYYVKLVVEELKQKIRWEYVREWLKGSTANVYNVIGNQLATVVFLFLFKYGGEGARGSYGAAIQVANVITYSAFLAFALYPKLLMERRSKDITTSLKMVLMFAVPMAAGAISLSDSYIMVFKQEYTNAGPILIVLALDALVIVVSGIFSSVVSGIETVDEKAKISFKELARSRLFILFSLPYVHSAITIPTTLYVLTVYLQNQPIQAALYVSIINSLARFAMFIVLYVIVRKTIKIDIPWENIAKYALASSAMAIFLLLTPHSSRIFLTLVETAIGAIIYLAALIAIDKEARLLAKTAWQEIMKYIKYLWSIIRGRASSRP
jgi:O-antigen/teichoic acid export membrane protein